jgi:uncharacterized membrane protein
MGRSSAIFPPSRLYSGKEPSRWQGLLIGGRPFAPLAGDRSTAIFGAVRNLTHSAIHRYARVEWVDSLRGGAVAGMVCYHFLYDLRIFFPDKGISATSSFWWIGHLVIAGSFFLISGVSAGLAAKSSVPLPHILRRVSTIAICALGVSFTTLLFLPDRWIYFGILHSLATCAFVCLPLRHYPRLCGVVALFCSIGYVLSGAEIPSRIDSVSSLDYVPFFPWVAVYLAGIFLCKFIADGWRSPSANDSLSWCALAWAGKRALPIYILHQPVLLGLLWVASCLT